MKCSGGLSVGLAAFALMIAGCGDDGDSTAATATGLDTEPAQLVSKMLAEASVAKKQKDCTFVATVNLRSTAKVICPANLPGIRKRTRGIGLTDAAVYGTGAVVDYRSPEARGGASILLFRNKQGLWSLSDFGLVVDESVGSSDEDAKEDSRAAVDSYLEAVRSRNCQAFFKYARTFASDVRKACKQELPATRPLAAALEANPDVSPRYLGGNAGFGFYAIETTKPRPAYYTISTAATPEGALRPHVVLSAQPGPSGP
jgi:hypothetical protein